MVNKISCSLGGAPKLQTLPPTNEAFRVNVAHAHLQVTIWRHALKPNPPHMDPLSFGWVKDEGSTSLVPRTVAENVALAPDAILNMIKCSCDSDIPCKTKRCGCYNANMPCMKFVHVKEARSVSMKEPGNLIMKNMGLVINNH